MNKNYTADTVKDLINKAGMAVHESPDKCIEYANEALKISQELNFPIGIGMSILDIGLGHFYKGNYTQAFSNYEKAKGIFKKNNFPSAISQLLNNFGALHAKLNEPDKALKCFLEAIEIDTKIKNIRNISLTLCNIGNVYKDSENKTETLRYYNLALSNAEEADFPYGMTVALTNLGNFYSSEKDYETALTYFARSKELCLKINNLQILFKTYQSIAAIYEMKKDYQKAKEIMALALPLAKKSKHRKDEIDILTGIASLDINTREYEKAEKSLLILEDRAEKENSKPHMKSIYKQLYNLKEKTDNPEEALSYYIKFSDITIELFRKQNNDKLSELQTKYETEKKEKEAEIYKLKAVELLAKNEEIEQQKNTLQITLNNLEKSELKYNIIADDFRKNVGLDLIGKSESITEIIDLINVIGKSPNTNVLIMGESGTGKEIVARKIHESSNRQRNNFYAVNSSAIPESLFESQFFGHEKNAFTGAVNKHIGWFEIANNGTLFLDEIGTMQLDRQIKLLRAIEEKTITRIGSHKDISFDTRIICATNDNLYELVNQKKFREDLYHRLSTFVIQLSPLRDRKEDIPVLLEHFVKKFSLLLNKKIKKIDKNIALELSKYDFPGNVRELKNIIERAVIISKSSTLKIKDVIIPKVTKKISDDVIPLTELEKNMILNALKKTNYSIVNAAELLQIDRRAVSRKMQKHNIKTPKGR